MEHVHDCTGGLDELWHVVGFEWEVVDACTRLSVGPLAGGGASGAPSTSADVCGTTDVWG